MSKKIVNILVFILGCISGGIVGYFLLVSSGSSQDDSSFQRTIDSLKTVIDECEIKIDSLSEERESLGVRVDSFFYERVKIVETESHMKDSLQSLETPEVVDWLHKYLENE